MCSGRFGKKIVEEFDGNFLAAEDVLDTAQASISSSP
jgi:hypothetical protein